jgi:hypothetical protein
MLALGSNPQLKALAVTELMGTKSHAEQAALAERWWEHGESAAGAVKNGALRRAAYWYSLGMSALDGLARARAERRIGEAHAADAPAGSHVPGDAIRFGGHYYQVFRGRTSWRQAKAKCEAMGGYLGCAESASESILFSQLADRAGGFVWAGGTDAGHEKRWMWISGRSFRYNDWCKGNPDNAKKREHYLGILTTREAIKRGGRWNDCPDAAKSNRGFICEWGE